MENRIMGRINGEKVLAHDEAKAKYMDSLTKMNWNQLFAELVRVHAESSRMLNEAYSEIDRVNELLNRDECSDNFDAGTSH
jgi:hypothetical protein